MQQTETYNLNLIESSDTFSPGPLNENMEKLEAALGTKTDTADHAALEQRVVTLEGRHVVAGTYTGDSEKNHVYQFIDLGFTPALMLASTDAGEMAAFAWEGRNWSVPNYPASLIVTENGFEVCSTMHLALNTKGKSYPFIAIG